MLGAADPFGAADPIGGAEARAWSVHDAPMGVTRHR